MNPLLIIAAAGAILGIAALIRALMPKRGSNTASRRDDTEPDAGEVDSRRLPYRFDHGSVFVWGEDVWCGFKLAGVNTNFLTQERIDGLANAATQALGSLSVDQKSVEVQLRCTHQPTDIAGWRQQLLAHAWNPSAWYRGWVDMASRYLEWAKMPTPTTYLFVKIDQIDTSALAGFAARVQAALMGDSDDVVMPDEVAKWHAQAEQVHRKLSGMGAVPCTRHDRMWVIRKTLSGHFTPTMDDFPQTKVWGPGQFQMWIEFRADNTARDRIVIDVAPAQVSEADRRFGDTQMKSHTAFLTVADWPAEWSTGWGSWLSRITSAVEIPEVTVRMTVTPPREFTSTLVKADQNITSEYDDMRKAGGDDSMIEEDRILAAQAAHQQRSGAVPGIRYQIIIQLSADSEAALDAEIDQFSQHVSSMFNDQVKLVRPRRWQYRLLQLTLPGGQTDNIGHGIVPAPYLRIADTAMFGAALPQGGTSIGDMVDTAPDGSRTGWLGNYLGSVGYQPVFYGAHVGPSRNRGGGVLIVGASGSGKSNLAMLMFLLESESGVECVALDPKDDFAQAIYYLAFGNQVNDPDFTREAERNLLGTPGSKFTPINPEFWADTLIVNVAKAQPGVMDPWQVEPDPSAAHALALAMFEMFLDEKQWDAYRDIIQSQLDLVVEEHQQRIQATAEQYAREHPGESPSRIHARAIRDTTPPTMWNVLQRVEEYAAVGVGRTEEDQTWQSMEAGTRFTTLAATVKGLRQLPFANLVFAENPQSGTSLWDRHRRRTIFTLRGMDVPAKGAAPSTPSQRMSSALMYAITRINSQRMTSERAQKPGHPDVIAVPPKLLVVDEANMVVGLPSGKQMLKENFGKGRSYNMVTMLLDQQVGRLADIEDDGNDQASGNQLHAVFAFAQASESEAKALLPVLRRNPDDPVWAKMMPVGTDSAAELTVGRCLFRDADSRLGVMGVDLLFEELFHAFDTNASRRGASQSTNPAPDPTQWKWLTPTGSTTSQVLI